MIVGDPADDLDPTKVFGAIFQYPGTYGHVRDFTAAYRRAARRPAPSASSPPIRWRWRC